jgi:hypothetical protein
MKFIKTLLFVVIATLFTSAIKAQSIGDYIDVVFLKNGSIIKGIIIEQIPGQTLRIQTSDGSQFVYQISEIEKYGRELKPGMTSNAAPATKPAPREPRVPKPFFTKEKGYFGDVTFLGGAGMGFRVTNGYKFGRFGYLGMAVGFEGLSTSNRNNYFGNPMPLEGMPGMGGDRSPFATANVIYAGDILNKKVTPFYQLELGYGMNLMPNQTRYYSYYDDVTGMYNNYSYQVRSIGGPMGGVAFGVKFNTRKRVNFKLALDARWHTNITDPINSRPGFNNGSDVNLDGGTGIRFSIGF